MPLEPGATHTLRHNVSERDLASSLTLGAEDAFPAVLATSRLIALMELTAARLMKPLLGPGELSVGVNIDITHTAPTPEGAAVVVTARYFGVEGKLHRFDIIANDPGGEIGRCRHDRAIVLTERLLAGARRRGGST